MSLAGYSAIAPPAGSAASASELSAVTRLYRLPVYLGCAVLALVANYVLGKEMAWDTLNYHFYSGFSALHDRFAQDYFAAGIQTYLNPYAYVPFYVLASSGLSALQVSSLLALLHSIILCLTFELALVLFPSGSRLQRVGAALCAVAIAAVNPILLQQLGTSFADITTGELVLGGWLLLAAAVRTPSFTRVIFAAVLLGAATALKPTNAVHSVAAAVMLIMMAQPAARRIGFLAAYGGMLGLSFAIVAAPWSLRLARIFGNPFFPLLNHVFRSPEFVTGPLRHLRFIPSSLAEALLRPFAMLDPVTMVHEELSAPDPRYAVLLALAGVLVVQWLRRRHHSAHAAAGTGIPADTRMLAALGSAFTVDWVAWLTVSGNSRYFLPMACVASVLLVGVLFVVFGTGAKARTYVLAAIIGTQALQLWMGAELRWNGVPWDGSPWFDVHVPPKLASERALYLSIRPESYSFVAPYLAPDAGLINLGGGYPLGLRGANGARLAPLIRQFTPRLRVLARGAKLYPDAEGRSPSMSEVNGALWRLGLRADPADCETITVHGLPPDLEPVFASSHPGQHLAENPADGAPADTSYLVSCGLVPDPTDHSSGLARAQAAGQALDRLEDACPGLFQPRRPPTDDRNTVSRRYYINSDLIAWVSHEEVKFIDPMHDDNIVHLGSESDWLRAPQRLICGRRHGHYFARLAGPPAAH